MKYLTPTSVYSNINLWQTGQWLISHLSNHNFKKAEIKLIKIFIQVVIKEIAKFFNKLRFETEQKIEKFKTSIPSTNGS